MACSKPPGLDIRGETGQSTILLLGMAAAVILGTGILTAFGQALGGKSRHQRAADLAAVSAARAMRADYHRLFEPAYLEGGAPNPRHLAAAAYIARARAVGVRAARRNGVRLAPADLTFPMGTFAPTRVTVTVRGGVEVDMGRRRRVGVRARAVAELAPSAEGGRQGFASGGGYDGPLAYRQGKPTCCLCYALWSRWRRPIPIAVESCGELP